MNRTTESATKDAASLKTTEDIVLRVRKLSKSFGNNHVLREFNVELHQGENLVVLGKSGSGKSVLIKCIIGLLEPDSGEINVLGEDVLSLDSEELDRLRVKVGFLFQSNALYDSMTVRENLEFPLRRHTIQLDPKDELVLVMEALANVGLEHTLDMLPAELSGGMRKRIALARTLILKPSIILYDEPTTGLDPITSLEIITLINKIREKYGTSALIISHDMNCVKRTADRIAVLVDGRCKALGTYEELSRIEDQNISPFFH
ncbi:MAG: ATP-binding cassette domain-containing protein [Saprospiraceae bacterium]|nr:ATP-binding cassette domain-containing protein [Saprospiraceae bacterium]HMW40174.1 ATP-binding cassette domain-containing protein [Saprospiraceae bacterium]HMX88256.1 ATP-binding cassette domain-containing protein [Saprospiraceae bacterium]HMZ40717.1 ATP-binding cassette domain-containing protein [Saprospiraceae bacterium]HNB32073.1 ATP-binding cassette domain-containing protein [Saprospiraceae bacterium]